MTDTLNFSPRLAQHKNFLLALGLFESYKIIDSDDIYNNVDLNNIGDVKSICTLSVATYYNIEDRFGEFF